MPYYTGVTVPTSLGYLNLSDIHWFFSELRKRAESFNPSGSLLVFLGSAWLSGPPSSIMQPWLGLSCGAKHGHFLGGCDSTSCNCYTRLQLFPTDPRIFTLGAGTMSTRRAMGCLLPRSKWGCFTLAQSTPSQGPNLATLMRFPGEPVAAWHQLNQRPEAKKQSRKMGMPISKFI